MQKIELNAYAKINLSIDVTGRRPNGYHDVVMVLQQIDLYDGVTVSRYEGGPAGSIRLTSDRKGMPGGQDNIAWKAAELMKETFPDGMKESVEIHIEKRIPVAAGLAGGSADAAAVLHGLNILWECGLNMQQLMEIGVKLGADVPFCIMAQAAKDERLGFGGESVSTCALAQGIGEKLSSLPPLSAFVVLLKPGIAVSTADIYRNLDVNAIEKRPDTDGLIRGLKKESFAGVKAAMYNVLEEVSVRKYPVINEKKRLLQAIGPEAKIMMSGSGPTVFALTTDKDLAQTIFNEIKLTNPISFFVQTSC